MIEVSVDFHNDCISSGAIFVDLLWMYANTNKS